MAAFIYINTSKFVHGFLHLGQCGDVSRSFPNEWRLIICIFMINYVETRDILSLVFIVECALK